jgi:hypothetical protein
MTPVRSCLGALAGLVLVPPPAAGAATTVALQHRTLAITGDDKVALRPAASSADRLEVDLGADGTADLVIGRGAFDRIRIDGGDGFDAVAFTGTPAGDRFHVASSGALVRLRDGGRAPTTLDGVEEIDAAALGGPDTVTVGDVTGTALQQVSADLGAGDGSRDRVTLAGTAGRDDASVLAFGGVAVIGLAPFVQIANAEPADHLTIEGRGDEDDLSARSVPAGTMGVTLDGGPGADVIFGGRAPTSSSAARTSTPSTAALATTSCAWGPTRTASPGTRETAATRSTVRAGTTGCSSSAPTTPRRSTSRRTAGACAWRAP